MSTLEHSALFLYLFGLLFLLIAVGQVMYYHRVVHLDADDILSTAAFAAYLIVLGVVCSIADYAVKRWNVRTRRTNYRSTAT